jgi:hypothetical protein
MASIRETQESDIENIKLLADEVFPESNYSKEEIFWLITQCSGEGKFNSYVAYDSDKLVGHIGYTISEYNSVDKEYTASYPVLWIVSKEARGVTGLQLLMKIFSKADFSLAVAGSSEARDVFEKIGFKHAFNTDGYHRILNLYQFCRGIKGSFKSRIVNILRTLVRAKKEKSKHNTINTENIKLEASDNYSENNSIDNSLLVPCLSESKFDWLIKAPKVLAKSYTIYDCENKLGNCVIYFNSNEKCNTTARIAYLPFLGSDKSLWLKVILKIEQHLVDCGVCAYSIMAPYEPEKEAVAEIGFTPALSPVWIYDKKSVIPEDSRLCITFIEGDNAYRGI